MAQPERIDPGSEMPPLPKSLKTTDDLDAEWGNQVVGYLGALNSKIDGVEQRLTARIDGVEQRLTARIDGVEQRLTARIDGVDADRRLEQRLTARIDGVEQASMRRSTA